MLSCGVNVKIFVLALLLLPRGVRGYKGVKFNSLKLSFNSVRECWSFSVRGIFIFTVLCSWIILHTSIFTRVARPLFPFFFVGKSGLATRDYCTCVVKCLFSSDMPGRGSEKRSCIDSPTREVWFKEPFTTTNPSRILIGEDDAVVDFLEKIMSDGYLRQWANSKANTFNVRHMGQLLDHDRKFNTINEEIGARTPLTIEVIDDSKFLVKIDSVYASVL